MMKLLLMRRLTLPSEHPLDADYNVRLQGVLLNRCTASDVWSRYVRSLMKCQYLQYIQCKVDTSRDR